jgi:hypothetical protein
MSVRSEDVAAFLDAILAELRSPEAAAVRILRVTALLDATEAKLDKRSLFGVKHVAKPGRRWR